MSPDALKPSRSELPAPTHAFDPHEYHARRDPHRSAKALSDVILGSQDGLVNILGVVLGVAAATGSRRVVLAAGLAAALAESVSMAAVAYTTRVADARHYESERAREYRHLQRVPEIERDEIREIYRAKGFEGALLERIVATITANPDVWVAVMMSEEHGLTRADAGRPLRSTLVVGVASLIGTLIPLAPFVFLPVRWGTWLSVALASAALFALGAYEARVTTGTPLRSGTQMVAIGLASALVGYAVGALFHAPAAP